VTVAHRGLAKAMRPLKKLIGFQFVRADDAPGIDQALAEGCDLFRYAGHTGAERGRGTMACTRPKDGADPLRLEALPEPLRAGLKPPP